MLVEYSITKPQIKGVHKYPTRDLVDMIQEIEYPTRSFSFMIFRI